MQYLGGKSKIAKYIAKIINEELEREREKMRYQGGKSNIAKPIAEIINRAGGGRPSCHYSAGVV